MKKIFLVAVFLFSIFAARAQVLPAGTMVSFSVANISKENQDAEKVGAEPGDMLRYELSIKTDDQQIENFSPEIDLQNLLDAAEIVNFGTGKVENNFLIFPKYSCSKNCEKNFSFFARVKKDCGGAEKISATTIKMETNVPLSCFLIGTGPSKKIFIFSAVAIFFFFLILFSARRKKI